jgi:hypothetical protein
MTESEHEVKARDFVDSILEVNRRHGVEGSSSEIEYDAAVKSAAEAAKRVSDSDSQLEETESGK